MIFLRLSLVCCWILALLGTCTAACVGGKWGPTCALSCSEYCIGNECDSETGDCSAGCISGYLGDNCDTACFTGTWGPGCENVCGAQCVGGVCQHENGTCTQGCTAGYQGSKCDSECPAGTWGYSCSNSCQVGCGGGDCDQTTGFCTSACVLGYNGDSCENKNKITILPEKLNVIAERPFGMIVLAQNLDKSRSKVYLTGGSETACSIPESQLITLEGKTGLQIKRYGIMPNVTGYSHFMYAMLLVTGSGDYVVNATLDNLGVITQHTINVFGFRESYVESCLESSYITNTGNMSTPAVVEYGLRITFSLVMEWDEDCLASYGATPWITAKTWQVRYSSNIECWMFGEDQIPAAVTTANGILLWMATLSFQPRLIMELAKTYVITANLYGNDGSNNKHFSKFVKGYIEVGPTRLVASLGPEPQIYLLWNETLTLDASGSTDPEGILGLSSMQYTWTCTIAGDLPCTIAGMTMSNDGFTMPNSSYILELPGRSLELETYVFEVTVSGAVRISATASLTVVIMNYADLLLEIICESNCRPYLLWDDDWVVRLNQTQEFPYKLSQITVQWRVYKDGQLLQLSNTDGETLTVEAALLQVDSVYSVQVEVTSYTNKSGTADLADITTTSLPEIGSCALCPTRGFFDGTFEVFCTGFHDVYTPLTYRMTTLAENRTVITVAESVDGNFSNAVLPDGDSDADYYRNFTMDVANSLGKQVSITFPVQVYPSVSEYITSINQPPVGSSGCQVSPQTGYALITNFTVTCGQFTDVDLPLMYYLYSRDQKNVESLLYKGNTSNISKIHLGQGHGENYTVTLVVAVKDFYKAATSIELSVQVLPFESSNTTVNRLDFVQKIFLSDDTGDSILTVDIARALVTVVNDDHADDDQESNRVKIRQNMRVALTRFVMNMNISDMDMVNQVTDLLEDLLKVPHEITEEQEAISVTAFDNLLSSLDMIDKSDTNKTRSTSKNLLSSMGTFLTTIKDRVTALKNVSDETEAEGETTVKMDKVKSNSLKMLASVEKVVDILTQTIHSPSEPLIVQTPVMTVVVQPMVPDNGTDTNITLYLQSTRNSVNTSINIQLPSRSVLLENIQGAENSSLYAQAVMTNDNMYGWDETADLVTSPVVELILKDRQLQAQMLASMSDPVILQFEIPDVNPNFYDLDIVYNTTTGEVMSSSTSRVTMLELNTDLYSVLYVKASETNLTVMVHVANNNDRPVTTETVQQQGIAMPLTDSVEPSDMLLLKGSLFSGTKLHIAIAVREGETVNVTETDMTASPNSTIGIQNVTVRLSTYKAMCGFYDRDLDKWATGGCIVSPMKNRGKLTCQCNHLTAFAAGFIVVPNLVDPIANAKLFLTFFENPLVVMTVVMVWCMYFFFLVWARRKDREQSMKGGVSILQDNCLDDRYVYVVGVVTGWWSHAGTTSNVFLCLHGSDGHSSKHHLSDGIVQHFETGTEDWFVLTTPLSLGELQDVVIWHDNTGDDPAWFLKQIVIRDIQTDEMWHFLYNDWLAVDRGVGQVKTTIPALAQKDLAQNSFYQFGLKSSKDLQNNHLWISIFSCPAHSPFTRVQRLSCALSLILTTMLASLMFHGIPTDDPADQVGSSAITFSMTDIIIGIESGLIMFPVNFIIMQLFTRLAPKPSGRGTDKAKHRRGEDKVKLLGVKPTVSGIKSTLEGTEGGDAVKAKEKKPFRLPWWMVYVAWVLVMSSSLVCSYFIMLYGLMYGYQKSVAWLLSFFTAFFQSTLVTQPFKVFIVAVLLTFIFKKPVEFEVLSMKEDVVLDDDEEYWQSEVLEKQGITVASTAPVKQAITPALAKKTLQAIRDRLKLEGQIATILREMLMYFTFVAIVLFMVHGHQDIITNYHATKNMEDLLINEKYTDMGLNEVSKVEDMWRYLETTVVPMVYADSSTRRMANNVSYLVGTARLRQKRIEQDDTCTRSDIVVKLLPNMECKGSFSSVDEEWGSFNASWARPLPRVIPTPQKDNPWVYRSSWELKTLPYVGKLASYSGGGYVAELPAEQSAVQKVLNDLKMQRWVDTYTRVIFLEFTSYNPNVDLFTVTIITFEMANLGNLSPFYQLFTSKLSHYDSDLGKFVAACEVLFLMYIIGFTHYEVKKYRELKKAEYFTDAWSYIEIMIIGLGYSVIGLFFQRLFIVDSVLKEYVKNGPNRYTSFYTAVFWDFVLTYVMAALVMLVILKVFKLFRFSTRTMMLVKTLAYARGNLTNFAFLFFIFFMAFVMFAHLVFGYWILDYKDLGSSIITLSNFLLGVSDYDELRRANFVLGPAFFFMFAFLVQYCLLSMFVVIVLDARSSLRKSGTEDLHVTKFVYERFLMMIGFLSKRDYN